MEVRISSQGADDLESLPETMFHRYEAVVIRLTKWPQVSGAKPLTGKWKDHRRIRMGDYRLIFHVRGSTVIVDRVAHRRDVY